MNLSTTLLGSTAVRSLQQTATRPVLQIGSDRLTRADLAGVECYNYVAAGHLTHVLHEQLQVKNLRDVYDNVPPTALALPTIGVVSLAVLGAAFEAKGLGGDDPLENWARKHALPGKKGQGQPPLTTFYTIKKHVADLPSGNGNKRHRRRSR
jgi:hypothetical protein